MLVSISKAHKMTGAARSTIYKDLEEGRLSFELNSRDKKVIQVSELERVYGLKANENNKTKSTDEVSENVVSVVKSSENTNTLQNTKSDQVAVLQERIKALSSTNDEKDKFISDLKEERNKTRNQFETKLSDLNDALSEAQKGYTQITKLLEDKSNETPNTAVTEAINSLEKRLSNQEKEAKEAAEMREKLKKLELAEEQRQQEAKAIEREKSRLKQDLETSKKQLQEEKSKSWWDKLTGK